MADRSRSTPAFTLIELLVVIAILAVLIGLLLSAVQNVRASAARLTCQNNMRQLGLALHAYHGTEQKLPPGLSVKSDGGKYPFLGWTARLLPYVEQPALWSKVIDAFATDPSPWTFYGHLPHQDLLGTPVKIFNCPSDPRLPGPLLNPEVVKIPVAFTSYLGVEGANQFTQDGCLFLDSRVRLTDITDGTSNTLMIGERPPPSNYKFGWWYRGWGQQKEGSVEMVLGVQEENSYYPQCPPGPYPFTSQRFDNPCNLFQFWSPHSGGANFTFADGSVRFLSYSADNILPALATRAGGEPAEVP